jgi:hypothetical protein
MAHLSELRSVMPCTFRTLIQHAQTRDSGLKAFCDANAFNLRPRDKGNLGKLVEFYLYGRLPNNDPHPDTEEGDIKATHVKKTRDGWCAKERLTLTNCGSTAKPETLDHLLADMTETRLYPKLRRGSVFVFEHADLPAEDKTVVDAFQYDLEALPEAMRAVLADDYAKIQACVRAREVSQRGQRYLHIHPHGSKGSSTRALGFTNKFLTTLLCHATNRPMRTVGRSLVF